MGREEGLCVGSESVAATLRAGRPPARRALCAQRAGPGSRAAVSLAAVAGDRVPPPARGAPAPAGPRSPAPLSHSRRRPAPPFAPPPPLSSSRLAYDADARVVRARTVAGRWRGAAARAELACRACASRPLPRPWPPHAPLKHRWQLETPIAAGAGIGDGRMAPPRARQCAECDPPRQSPPPLPQLLPRWPPARSVQRVLPRGGRAPGAAAVRAQGRRVRAAR